MTTGTDSILVIKLSALGDFIQATGPFAAIRRHHPDARIVLLTTRPYAAFAEGAPWFDEVWIDSRPRGLDLGGWLGLRRRIRRGGFSRIYDLQTSNRSALYYRLLWPGPYPEWSGIAKGCSHPHANPNRDSMHTLDRQAGQLRTAGIDAVPAPDLSWAKANVRRFGTGGRYALIVPGGAPHRPQKRWPAERFAAIAARLESDDVRPVLIGLASERDLLARIAAKCADALNLAGATSLADLAVLARGAYAAVGNDTGPMHVAAVAGCPSLVLYSEDSDPALCGQRGPQVEILRRPRLAELSTDEVMAALNALVP